MNKKRGEFLVQSCFSLAIIFFISGLFAMAIGSEEPVSKTAILCGKFQIFLVPILALLGKFLYKYYPHALDLVIGSN